MTTRLAHPPHRPEPSPLAAPDPLGDLPPLNLAAPVIVIGMHRSGTSLLMQLLQRCGLMIGNQLDHNHEALFFQRLNQWLMRQVGAQWYQPDAFDVFLQHPQVQALSHDYLHAVLRSRHTVSYLGWRGYLHWRGLHRVDRPWGWKDPRNTYTLPVWLRLFPNARVIHITRHGIDVAASLRTRQQRTLEHKARAHQRHRRRGLYQLKLKTGGFTDALRCADLRAGFDLWEKYVSLAQSHVLHLGDQAMELRYEDLLADPRAMLARTAAFCELPVNQPGLDEAVASIRPDRCLAYRRSDELRAEAQRAAHRLTLFGYEA